MEPQPFFEAYWHYVAAQDEAALGRCFQPGAVIRWHCSNESFTVEEFLRANCEYPGRWSGRMERLEECGGVIVTATRVWSGADSFHVCSFFRLAEGLIAELDEYWGDDGDAPQWRQNMGIGRPIR